MHFAPNRHAAADEMALVVARQMPPEQRHERGPFGPRADDRHVAAQHVEELRELVDARAAQERAHSGGAAVGRRSPDRAGLGLGVDGHRTEFKQVELDAAAPDAPLPVQDRSARLQMHRDSGDEHERPDERETDEGDAEIDEALEQPRPRLAQRAAATAR